MNFKQDESSSLTSTTPIALGPQKPFIHFDLDLTKEERDALKILSINSLNHYENYGDLTILYDEVNQYIASLGEENSAISKTIAQLVVRLVEKVTALLDQESAWVTMRAFTPTLSFKEPRWHSDNYYYPPTGEQYKVAITLKGDGTLFYNASPEHREALEKFKHDSVVLKEKLNNSMVVVPQFGEGSIFVVGMPYAPIHSEPNIKNERLFLSMIPGSKEQILKLYQETPEQQMVSLLTNHGFYCYFVGPRLQDHFIASPYENTEILVFTFGETEPYALSRLSTTIKSYHPEIKTEAILDNDAMLKCIFPKGAIITLNDISWFFSEKKYDSHSDQNIYLILNEYVEKAPSFSKGQRNTDSIEKPYTRKFAVNTIQGKNTTGLFKPKPINNRILLSGTPMQLGLGPEKPFINFDLELIEEEVRCLKELKIDSINHYENYGDFEILYDEVNLYIASLGEGNVTVSKTVANVIVRLIQKILNFTRLETAWVTLRAFTPISTFREPRWHPDRYDYPPTGEQYKGAITLKGPSTLFYDVPLEERKNLEGIKHDKVALDKEIDKSKLVSAKSGEGTIFIVGAPYAPIHSEPNINDVRLFLSVMPGSKEQIQKVYKETPEQGIIPLLVSHGFYCYFVGPRPQDKFVASPYENTEIIVFRLLDKAEPHALDTIATIVKSYDLKISIEATAESMTLKASFPQGGAILISDISWFFIKNQHKINSEDDVSLILKEYADSLGKPEKIKQVPTVSNLNNNSSLEVENETNDNSIKTAPLSRKFAYNGIFGKNTTGLFRPGSNYYGSFFSKGDSGNPANNPSSSSNTKIEQEIKNFTSNSFL